MDQPQKRPRSSWVRFEAALGQRVLAERHDPLARGRGEGRDPPLHRRLLPGVLSSKVLRTATAPDTIELFYATAATWGLPACVLLTMAPSTPPPIAGRRPASRSISLRSASASSTASPTIPRPRARSSATTRPSRSGSVPTMSSIPSTLSSAASTSSPATTTRSVPTKRTAVTPLRLQGAGQGLAEHRGPGGLPSTKVRRDRVDTNGTVTLRHRSKLHHIGVGRAHKNERVLMLVADSTCASSTRRGPSCGT